MKIAVLTSGGVDSSVALKLLQEQDHQLTAFYLKIWLEDELSYLGDCPWEEDLKYLRQICADWKIPLEIIPFQQEYWNKVMAYTIAEVKAGRTPNPDILCNQLIKFGVFYEAIDSSYDKIASGHYAQTEIKNGLTFLKKSPDLVKDQTYFLSHLSQAQVQRALFPIGHLTKNEVRELAQKYNLPNQNRKDSQGLCFLGKIKFKEFLRHHLGEKAGDITEQETGKKLGEHRGYWYHTIGQRSGLKLSGGPWFVIAKDIIKNIVYVSHQNVIETKARQNFNVTKLNWITSEPSVGSSKGLPSQNDSITLQVKIRHGVHAYNCMLKKIDNRRYLVTLDHPDRGLAPGQFAVFYDGEYCWGGGVIE